MATKEEKKKAIRQQIVDAAQVYSTSLAGKTFLYVYGEEYFDSRHIYANAKKKLPCLIRLDELKRF